MKTLEQYQLPAVSGGGPLQNVLGGMYHKDAHAGPGGLYGPGGQLHRDAGLVEMMYGVDVMTLLAYLVYQANKEEK